MIPVWLHVLSIVALRLGLAVALWIVWDEATRPQQMWVMNLVWPLTARHGAHALACFDAKTYPELLRCAKRRPDLECGDDYARSEPRLGRIDSPNHGFDD